jgi:hypothetical protein
MLDIYIYIYMCVCVCVSTGNICHMKHKILIQSSDVKHGILCDGG